ncbi:hypothetical protein C3L33_19958, partial [Rhododendron williamsianum]
MDQQMPQDSSSRTQKRKKNVAAKTIEPENKNLEGVKKEYWRYILLKAALRGNWDEASRIFVQYEGAITAPIGMQSETVLQTAVGAGERAIHFVEKLVELMPVEALALQDRNGITTLHTAASVGNKRAVVVLVQKNPDLVYISNSTDHIPVHNAAKYACKDILLFLLAATKDDHVPRPFSNERVVRLVNYAITSGFFDVALNLVQRYTQAAKSKVDGNEYALARIARKPSAFPSGSGLNFWQHIIYCCVPVKLETNPIKDPLSRGDLENPAAANRRSQVIVHKYNWSIWARLLKDFSISGLPLIKHIQEQKQMHLEALTLLKFVCDEVRSLDDSGAFSSFTKDPVISATKLGIHEVIEEILDSFPETIWMTDNDNRTLFERAVINRNENVFNLLYQMGDHKLYIKRVHDYGGPRDTIWHLAGRLAPQRKLDLIPSAALQMQRELQWFQVRHLTF